METINKNQFIDDWNVLAPISVNTITPNLVFKSCKNCNSSPPILPWINNHMPSMGCNYLSTPGLKSSMLVKGASGPWSNIKMTSYQYRKSHCGDKTILRPSYFNNVISYADKMTSLYWIGGLIVTGLCNQWIPRYSESQCLIVFSFLWRVL